MSTRTYKPNSEHAYIDIAASRIGDDWKRPSTGGAPLCSTTPNPLTDRTNSPFFDANRLSVACSLHISLDSLAGTKPAGGPIHALPPSQQLSFLPHVVTEPLSGGNGNGDNQQLNGANARNQPFINRSVLDEDSDAERERELAGRRAVDTGPRTEMRGAHSPKLSAFWRFARALGFPCPQHRRDSAGADRDATPLVSANNHVDRYANAHLSPTRQPFGRHPSGSSREPPSMNVMGVIRPQLSYEERFNMIQAVTCRRDHPHPHVFELASPGRVVTASEMPKSEHDSSPELLADDQRRNSAGGSVVEQLLERAGLTDLVHPQVLQRELAETTALTDAEIEEAARDLLREPHNLRHQTADETSEAGAHSQSDTEIL